FMLFTPVFTRMPSTIERTLHVNGNDGVPLVFRHIEDHAITQNTSIIDENVQFAECVDCTLDDAFGAFEISYVFIISDCVAASGFDFINDLLSRAIILACPVKMTAKVIDDDFCPVLCQQQRFLTADTTTSACDDRNFLIEQHTAFSLSN